MLHIIRKDMLLLNFRRFDVSFRRVAQFRNRNSFRSENYHFKKYNMCTLVNKPLQSRPPIPVRAMLIGCAAGLGTPLFMIGGAWMLWWRYLPKSTLGTVYKYAIAVAIGGGGVTLIQGYMVPFLRDHAEFLLPFSTSNAIASIFWYSVGEIFFGLELMMSSATVASLIPLEYIPTSLLPLVRHIPLTGAVIGCLTAITAPLLWPIALHYCWNEELRNFVLQNQNTWPVDLYAYFIIPLGLPIGILAGSSLQLALQPLIIGIPGRSWTLTTLPALLGLVGISAYYYGINKPIIELFLWERRIHPITGISYSFNNRTGAIRDTPVEAELSKAKRSIVKVFHWLRYPWSWSSNLSTNYPTPRSLKNLLITANIMVERQELVKLVDLLLRCKHIQQCIARYSSSDEEEDDLGESLLDLNTLVSIHNDLQLQAYNDYGISDLKQLLKDFELAVSASNQIKIEQATFNATSTTTTATTATTENTSNQSQTPTSTNQSLNNVTKKTRRQNLRSSEAFQTLRNLKKHMAVRHIASTTNSTILSVPLLKVNNNIDIEMSKEEEENPAKKKISKIEHRPLSEKEDAIKCGKYAIALVLENLEFFEEELLQKLGCTIPQYSNLPKQKNSSNNTTIVRDLLILLGTAIMFSVWHM